MTFKKKGNFRILKQIRLRIFKCSILNNMTQKLFTKLNKESFRIDQIKAENISSKIENSN